MTDYSFTGKGTPLCQKSGNADLFFAIEDQDENSDRAETVADKVDTAKKICRKCPYMTECLLAALENNEEFGIWGGTTRAERKQIKRRIKKTQKQSLYV